MNEFAQLREAAAEIVRGLHETAAAIRKANINGFGNAVADHGDALAALLARLEAAERDASEKVLAAEALVRIHFNIAAECIGEDEVRNRRASAAAALAPSEGDTNGR